MPRTISMSERFSSEQLRPGLFHERLYPGGKDGPNGEVRAHVCGGQVWSDTVIVGDLKKDSFQLAVPDIRLPANQIWPLHWHDCWVGIVILEGECMIGDWWMKAGDVLITAAELEYGPLLIGPAGCRMFEIFAKLHLHPGGYAKEYRDHPTLQGVGYPPNFADRVGINKRNEGHQVLPIDGVAGLTKGKLTAGAQWDLGEHDDPERSVMRVIDLKAGQALPTRRYQDWHVLMVMEGALQAAGRAIERDDYLLAHPGCCVDDVRASEDGALVLEVVRTARGLR
jgi:hypothetical protein